MAASKHIVIISILGWGHTRPLVGLSCRILQQSPNVGITILAVGDVLKKTVNEVSRYLAHEDEAKKNLRVISMMEEGHDHFTVWTRTPGAATQYYQWLYEEQPIKCLATGTIFEPWPKPTAVIADVVINAYKALRKVDPSIPLFAWNSASNPSMLHFVGPHELGGLGDIRAQALVESRRTGRPATEIEVEICVADKGNVLQIPGLPAIYDYELIPQQRIDVFDRIRVEFATISYLNVREADGVITSGSEAFEGETIKAFSNWLSQSNKRFYAVGPLLPFEEQTANQGEMNYADKGSEVEVFLEKSLKEYGERSVLYISFGSTWWPDSQQVWKFMEVVVDLNIPFIFAIASPKAIVPEELKEKVIKSALGIFSKWAPQQLILRHKATGWCLTHCGQNSVIECLAEGIPMIAWPLVSDQPANAISLSMVHDVAYHLLQARTGDTGLRPLKQGVKPEGTLEAVEKEARMVLTDARGIGGARKRKNAEAIKAQMAASWKKGGEASRQLNRFLTREILS